MMSRGYTPGKPVSRWEADSDNIDIEYKNLDQPRQQSMISECFSGGKGCVLKILTVIVIFVIGLVLGCFIQKSGHNIFISPSVQYHGVLQDYDSAISKQLQARVTHVDNYIDSITTLTSQSPIRISGMGNLNGLVNYVVAMWNTFHFDTVKVKKYFVQLSYPNYTRPNNVSVHSLNGSLVFLSKSNATNENVAYLPFNAYAKSGVVKGPLVYAHYGRKKDFESLNNQDVAVNGSVVLIRYGRIHPGNKVKHAEEAGAIAVVFYCDPDDYTDGTTNVDGTWWLPSWAVQLSHVRFNLVGDPSSPDYTAIPNSSNKKNINNAGAYPAIPVYPIMYSDADKLMSFIDQSILVPNDWNGKLKSKYYAGPKRGTINHEHLIEVSVHNTPEKRNISNVIASIKGKYEPDHYVIIGSHMDSWTQGAVDAGTGFAILMDLARTFSDQIMEGWRPRRTIIFAVWDASKYGHIGAYEWVQEYEKQLGTGAVAYINLDSAVRGDYSFYAESSPLLYDIIYKAAMTVNCVESHLHATNMSVYDMWKRNFPSTENLERPEIQGLTGDSDQSPFSYHIGVPSMSVAYTYNTKTYYKLPTYPAYSTLEDTLDYLQSFIDTNFTRHIAVNQILADVVLQLADSALLPFNITNYIHIMRMGEKCLQTYEQQFKEAGISLDDLRNEIDTFIDSTQKFQNNFTKAGISEYQLHAKNEKLLHLTRAFIVGKGLPDQNQYRNVLIAPHYENLDTETTFPGIVYGALQGKATGSWDILRQQVIILTITIQRASSILNEEIYTQP